MSLQDTPRSERVHIGIYGRRNSGKSSLINALTHQEAALVCDVAGTTTDPVYKAMEIHGIGPCVFIDTAGFDDEGDLGTLRIQKTEDAVKKTDLAIVVFTAPPYNEEAAWIIKLKEAGIPILPVLNKSDLLGDTQLLAEEITQLCAVPPIIASTLKQIGVARIEAALIRQLSNHEERDITEGLVNDGDTVLLVMPQDIQAPKRRLILPQVQTIRELLDKKCLVLSCTADKVKEALAQLQKPPALIITDSQVFGPVYDLTPKESLLTSFSVLFAAYKGDVHYFIKSAQVLNTLTESSRVLIAEACTHAPLDEDIGRVKLPRMLKKRIGSGLHIDIVNGQDFPADLTGYDLVIHCGACMFNRKYVLSRVTAAKHQQVPMSNYGIVIACLTGILDKIAIPPDPESF